MTLSTTPQLPLSNSPNQTAVYLPMPNSLNNLLETTELSIEQKLALQDFLSLPFNAQTVDIITCIERALKTLEDALPKEDTAVQRAKKFDIYDEFFNVGRATEQTGQTYIHGLLLTYARALQDMSKSDHHMTVIEIPLLRVAVESTLQLFDIGEPA